SNGLTKEQERNIVEHINRKCIKDLNRQLMIQAIYSDPGKPIAIAPAQQEKQIDEEIKLDISEDQMKAYITLLPPLGGDLLSKSDILSFIEDKNIVAGIDNAQIANLLEHRKYNTQIQIAM